MRVHHLNCGTMRPPGTELVCHVLLLETDGGLVLVDTGFGAEDVADPSRIGPVRHLIRPALVREQTALWQVRQLGFDPADVGDVVLTHFDLDHAGGLADFPHARVHLTAAEALAATTRPSWLERQRYPIRQQAHGPRLVAHEPGGGTWRGLPGATEVLPGVLLIPLPGHSRGHAGVAVDDRILHAGDAFYHHATLTGGRVPPILRLQEAALAYDRAEVTAGHERLAELARDPSLRLVNGHDPQLLDG